MILRSCEMIMSVWACWLLLLYCHDVHVTLTDAAFVSPSIGGGNVIGTPTATICPALFFKRIPSSATSKSSSSSQLNMVFDFLSERSKEGMKQLSNLAQAGYKGELGKGLTDIAVYTAQTNQAFANGLAKSRIQLLDNLESLFTGASPLEDVLDDLTDILLQADLGLSTAEDIVAEVKSLYQSSNQKRLSKDDLKSIMRGKLIEAFQSSSNENDENDNEDDDNTSTRIKFSTDPNIPTVLFIMGANGMGKTTTIGKLAHRLRTEGNQTVLLAACDTFRAGAVEQLQQWANRAEVDLVGPNERLTTPSAVLFQALDKAVKDKYDTVLVDTSGRLSNNEPLTAELAKMIRVIQKRLSVEKDADNNNTPIPNVQVPHETLLVLDAAQGRMALDSAKIWNQQIGLSGLILTKLDGSARGGSVVAIRRDLQLPVKLIGVGEGIDDLRDFDPERFVDSLLGIGAAGGKSGGAGMGIPGMGGGGSISKVDQEGAMLAKRLTAMRQERNARNVQASTAATAKSKQPIATAAAAAASATMTNRAAATTSSSSSVRELTNNGSPTATKPGNPRRKDKSKKKKGKK